MLTLVFVFVFILFVFFLKKKKIVESNPPRLGSLIDRHVEVPAHTIGEKNMNPQRCHKIRQQVVGLMQPVTICPPLVKFSTLRNVLILVANLS